MSVTDGDNVAVLDRAVGDGESVADPAVWDGVNVTDGGGLTVGEPLDWSSAAASAG